MMPAIVKLAHRCIFTAGKTSHTDERRERTALSTAIQRNVTADDDR